MHTHTHTMLLEISGDEVHMGRAMFRRVISKLAVCS